MIDRLVFQVVAGLGMRGHLTFELVGEHQQSEGRKASAAEIGFASLRDSPTGLLNFAETETANLSLPSVAVERSDQFKKLSKSQRHRIRNTQPLACSMSGAQQRTSATSS